jgi:hypothetical protein
VQVINHLLSIDSELALGICYTEGKDPAVLSSSPISPRPVCVDTIFS